MRTILCRYGEITTKGQNRIQFERCLIRNLSTMLDRHCISHAIQRKRGRILVTVQDEQQEVACGTLRRVFGLTSVSPALAAELTYPAIEQAIREILDGKLFSTFRVSAQRLQKTLDTSLVIQQKLGRFIAQTFGKKVDLTHPGIDVGIELIDRAYLFTERLSAPGGLPVGIEGTVLALAESPADLLAAWLAMKRGCTVVPVQRNPYPTTLLVDYGCTQPPIRINHLKELDGIAAQRTALALISGQMLDAITGPETALPVLRPLVGFPESQITAKLEEIRCTPS